MRFTDYLELAAYWVKYPPIHILARGYLGYKPPPSVEEENRLDALFQEIVYGKKPSNSNAPVSDAQQRQRHDFGG